MTPGPRTVGLGAILAASLCMSVSCSSSSSSSTTSEDQPDPACVEPDAGLPTDVFCTGLYRGRSSTQYASNVMPYQPGVTLWSDGAEKRRYLYLPPSSTIDTSNLDAWKFPVGTKAWKEFRVDGVLVETRLFWKRETKWEAGTYVWDATGANATLNTNPKGIILASGYEIPTTKDCDKCHHGGSDRLLGVEAVALALPTAQGATLTELAQRGALSHPPATTTVSLPEDATGKAAAALGYVHANCGMPCHSARGLGEETQLVLRVRAGELWPTTGVPSSVATTDIFLATVGQEPTTASVAQQFPGARRITPGAHDKSLVWLVSHLRGNYQMPPLVSHRIDDVGTQLLADWIDALPR
ncbi:hypothetical protein AKJ09_01534 [Labilithrix luteola]|uniref:Cytochrome c domain-containing protein n=1 Tax=Labilithrix luteola TaxID=1391654 RepID=A0A0K1PMV4_9BACT|nr:hypothetical protein [Labilithrix luteola]AKU94870.1 hypothetical protein AKJ09_01534 [Labilithrix luteola]